ncbi:C45 family autoproteolytic acyltransferase/hydolase [Egbenema bharatensis]|uniref:C45 family autoproteolytic acyltransferase/hydolase n=1 Tax=Egbenema bharatensis TaxID=3463334 RepID=UPI003A8801B2
MWSKVGVMQGLRRFRFWQILWGAAAFLLILVSRAHAAETIQLQYYDLTLNVPLAELQDFAETGTPSPELQQFFQQAQQEPATLRDYLTSPIPVQRTPLISDEFALIEINKVIGEPLGRERLEPLATAFREATKADDSFSVMELLAAYPDPTVRLSLEQLVPIYRNVELFLTRIRPVLSVTQELLPELICDCENSGTASAATSVTTSVAGSSTTSDHSAIATTTPAVHRSIPDSKDIRSAPTYQQLSHPIPSLFSDLAFDSASGFSPGSSTHPELSIASASRQPAAADLPNRELILQLGPLRPSISLAELTDFVETGTLSPGWRFYLNVARIKPENLRSALTQEIQVDGRFLDKTLNSLLGEYLLYQVSQIVHTPSRLASIQALRSALVLSALEDNRLTFLELLARYPTQQMILDGQRLARLGQLASRFEASGGVATAVVSLEDWLVEVQASIAQQICTCDEPPANPTVITPLTIAPETVAQYLPPDWQPVSAHREDIGNIKVVWLQGTPYEMGYQHGQYLHDEIASIGEDVITALHFAGRGLALGHLAKQRSYPDAAEECRGLTDATQDLGITFDACMMLAYGDVYQSIFGYTLPKELFWEGCSQFVATNAATIDGYLYHGSTVDNSTPIDYVIKNPVVFVRQPQAGLPHVFVTYPGVVWPNSGLNVAGISLGLDTAETNDTNELAFAGGSNVQMMAQILQGATSFQAAAMYMESQPKVHPNIIMVADGNSKQAGVLEFTGRNFAVRQLPENGVLYATNHFVTPEMFDKQAPPNASTLSRYDRYKQLLEPEGSHSYYGRIDPEKMTEILRDRINPYTLEASPLDLFDDNSSPGGNGSLRQAIYDPKRLHFWVAAGKPPVPENPFVCFSLGELLEFSDAVPCTTPAIE